MGIPRNIELRTLKQALYAGLLWVVLLLGSRTCLSAEVLTETSPCVFTIDANDIQRTNPDSFLNVQFSPSKLIVILTTQNKLRVYDLVRRRRVFDISAVAPKFVVGEPPKPPLAINVRDNVVATVLSDGARTISLATGERRTIGASEISLCEIRVDENGQYVALDAMGNVFQGDKSTSLRHFCTLPGPHESRVMSPNGQFVGQLSPRRFAAVIDLKTRKTGFSIDLEEVYPIELCAITSSGQLVLVSQPRGVRMRTTGNELLLPSVGGITRKAIDNAAIGISRNGAWLVYPAGDSSFCIYEVATRNSLLTWKAPASYGCCAISDDAKYAVTTSRSSQQAYVWDVDALLAKQLPREMPIEEAWEALKRNDQSALIAQRLLIRKREAAIRLISEQIARCANEDIAASLVVKLGSDDFTTRERASTEICNTLPWSETYIKKLAAASQDLEVQIRLQGLVCSTAAAQSRDRAIRCWQVLQDAEGEDARSLRKLIRVAVPRFESGD